MVCAVALKQDQRAGAIKVRAWRLLEEFQLNAILAFLLRVWGLPAPLTEENIRPSEMKICSKILQTFVGYGPPGVKEINFA